MVNIHVSEWFSPCQEPHPKVEFPRREEDSPNSMDFIDTIFCFQDDNDDDDYVYITHEQLDEVHKRVARDGWLKLLNEITEDQRK
jgi:hypothetical protein